MSILRARGLGHRFGRQAALAALDLDLDPGDRMAVLGANGAGKTTLLRLAATALRPTEGSLELFGQDAVRERSAVRGRLGYVAHHPGLYPELTALENLEFFAVLFGVPRSHSRRWLGEVGLEGEGGRLAGSLSRGQQQRLALARALLPEPELLILDEPDASLDRAGLALLRQATEGRTLLLATHDLALAGQLCPLRLVLEQGRQVRPPQLGVVAQ